MKEEKVELNEKGDSGDGDDDWSTNILEVRQPKETLLAWFNATFRSYQYFFSHSTPNLKLINTAAARYKGRHIFKTSDNLLNIPVLFERLLYLVEL